MIDDEEFPDSMTGDAAAPAVQAVCFFDSSRELRGFVEEVWQEFQAGFGDEASAPELAGLALRPECVGARIDIDAGMEVSLCLFPVLGGEQREDLSVVGPCPLFQLHDDGNGSVDPGQLQAILSWLLEDILPLVGHYDADALEECFGGGRRSLLLSDTCGRLLELPDAMMDDT